MKTRKSKISKVFSISVLLLLMISVTSCSNNDDGMSSSIEAKTQTFEVNGVNNCNTSSGAGSTLFMYIPYTSPAGTSIEKLQVKTTVSNGESDNKTNTVFIDENNIIEWATCFRFGSQTWVEFEVRLEDADGTLSNATTVRINKPAGAN